MSFDPLHIDGQAFVIVNNNRYALSTETADVPNEVSGLGYVDVTTGTENGVDVYMAAGEQDLPLWTFEAAEGGTYRISTIKGGEKQYLHIGVTTAQQQNAAVSLSSEPQEFSLSLERRTQLSAPEQP